MTDAKQIGKGSRKWEGGEGGKNPFFNTLHRAI